VGTRILEKPDTPVFSSKNKVAGFSEIPVTPTWLSTKIDGRKFLQHIGKHLQDYQLKTEEAGLSRSVVTTSKTTCKKCSWQVPPKCL
jgi:hypothetical protein